jgi:hypothetical protein
MGVASGNSGAEFAPLRLDVLDGNCAGFEIGPIVVGARIPRPNPQVQHPNVDQFMGVVPNPNIDRFMAWVLEWSRLFCRP